MKNKKHITNLRTILPILAITSFICHMLNDYKVINIALNFYRIGLVLLAIDILVAIVDYFANHRKKRIK